MIGLREKYPLFSLEQCNGREGLGNHFFVSDPASKRKSGRDSLEILIYEKLKISFDSQLYPKHGGVEGLEKDLFVLDPVSHKREESLDLAERLQEYKREEASSDWIVWVFSTPIINVSECIRGSYSAQKL